MISGTQVQGPDSQGSGLQLLAQAVRLAFPRAAGSAGDRRIIALLQHLFRELGLVTTIEPFSYDMRPALWSLRLGLIAGALLSAAAGLALNRSPLLSALLLTLALLPGLLLLGWAPWLEQLYRRAGPIHSANVVGRRPARDARLTLIVLAHHDSKSQNLSLPARATLTLLTIVALLLLGALVLGALVGDAAPGPPWLPPLAGGIVAAAALTLATLRSGNRSPGGVDNAGSVSILLELARVLPGRVDPDVELIFLATGAEEDHMVGAMRWLDAHGDALRGRPVFCLNYDGAGSPGRLVLLERYGLGRLFSPAMSQAARQAAARLGIPLRHILMPPAMGIDAICFVHRHLPCLTLSSGSLGRATAAIHSAGDRAELLDAATLSAAAELGRELLVDLASRDAGSP